MNVRTQILHQHIDPLICGIKECVVFLQSQQHQNFLGSSENTYLQDFLASHSCEMIGKIYKILLLFSNIKDDQLDKLIATIKDDMKEGSHKLDEIFKNADVRNFFGIEEINRVKNEDFIWQLKTDFYAFKFSGGSVMKIYDTEAARYGIFSKNSSEIFLGNRSDTNNQLAMMLGMLQDFYRNNFLCKV